MRPYCVQLKEGTWAVNELVGFLPGEHESWTGCQLTACITPKDTDLWLPVHRCMQKFL